MIIFKTAQNFLNTKFLSQQHKILQKIAWWHMNSVIREISIHVIKAYDLEFKALLFLHYDLKFFEF